MCVWSYNSTPRAVGYTAWHFVQQKGNLAYLPTFQIRFVGFEKTDGGRRDLHVQQASQWVRIILVFRKSNTLTAGKTSLLHLQFMYLV
jgi:hypothetical protein